MENESKKKKYYKDEIIKLINGIDNLDFLIYLNRLLHNIVKAGR